MSNQKIIWIIVSCIIMIIDSFGCSGNISMTNYYENKSNFDSLVNNQKYICARLISIDTLFYSNYNVFTFSYGNNSIYEENILFAVLSLKENNNSVDTVNALELEENKIYCLRISKIKTALKSSFLIKGRGSEKQFLDHKGRYLFYHWGYIVDYAYFSDNIVGFRFIYK